MRRRPSGIGKLLANIFPQYTPVSYTLLTINFVLFLVIFLSERTQTGEDFTRLLMGAGSRSLATWGADVPALVAAGQWWRLVSAIFIHIGIIHLMFNSYALIFICPLLEELLGPERFLALYLATGVVGYLVSNLWYPPYLTTAGASGSIFGMIGLAIVISKRWGSWGSALQQQLIHWAIYAFAFGLFIGANNAAHLGGLVSGIGFAFTLSNPNRPNDSQVSESLWRAAYWICVAVTLLSLGLAIRFRLLVSG